MRPLTPNSGESRAASTSTPPTIGGAGGPGLSLTWIERYPAASLCVIFFAGLALRVYGLGSESIWLDEATSIYLAKMSIADLIRWTAVDIHPPLYYILLHVWLVFGDGEAQVRLLSALAGVASIPVLYLLGKRLFSPFVGLAAAALLAFSPLHVWYSQETRMYPLLALFGLLTTYCMVRALLDEQRWAWGGYVVCTILSLYTHYYTFFILLFQNAAALYLLWHKDIAAAAFKRWLGVQIVSAVVFLPWLPVLVHQVQSGGGSWVARTGVPALGTLAATAANFSLGPDTRLYFAGLRRFAYLLFGALFALGVLSASRAGRAARSALAISLIYLCLPLLAAWTASQLKPLYSLRYLLPFLPPYYILIAQGIAALRTINVAGRRAPAVLWSAAFYLLLAIGLVGISASASTQETTDWRGLVSHVLDEATPADVVLFAPGWNIKPFDYYARGRIALDGNTPIPITPGVLPDMVSEATQGRARLWVVQAEGHYADPQNALGAYLDKSYPLLERERLADNIVLSLYRTEH
jgi:mannosyltransferase